MTIYRTNNRKLPLVREIARRAKPSKPYPMRVTVIWRNRFMITNETRIALKEPICMKLTNEPDWERLKEVPAMILVAKGPSILFAIAKKKKLTNINTGCIGPSLFLSEVNKLYHQKTWNTTIIRDGTIWIALAY